MCIFMVILSLILNVFPRNRFEGKKGRISEVHKLKYS
jgi:hypothetical protein